MPEPLPISQINFLVPLLMVIVERLANLTRSMAEDPTDYADTRPIFVPVGDGGNRSGRRLIPWLGRLNFLHATNVILLTVSFILLAATEQGLVTNVLAILVAIVWLQLPLIEVDLYDDIRDTMETRWPTSLYAHVAGTVVIMAYVAGFGGFDPAFFLRNGSLFAPDPGLILNNPAQVGATLLLAGLVATTAGGFLHLFDAEVRTANEEGNGHEEEG